MKLSRKLQSCGCGFELENLSATSATILFKTALSALFCRYHLSFRVKLCPRNRKCQQNPTQIRFKMRNPFVVFLTFSAV